MRCAVFLVEMLDFSLTIASWIYLCLMYLLEYIYYSLAYMVLPQADAVSAAIMVERATQRVSLGICNTPILSALLLEFPPSFYIFVMLRLPATKIELGSRDLVWHTHRYQNRKLEYERTGQVPQPSQPVFEDNQDLRLLPYHFPRALSHVAGRSREYDDSLISEEPVPRTSTAFWEDVVASVTTPLLRAQHHRNILDEDVSTSSLASFDDSRVLESTRFGDRDVHSLILRYANERTDFLEPAHTGANDSALWSHTSTESSLCPETPKDNDTEEGDRQSLKADSISNSGSRHRLSFFTFHRRGRRGSLEEDPSRVQTALSSQLDLDGSTDAMTATAKRQLSTSSVSLLEPETQMLLPHRTRRGRRTNSSTFEIDINVSEDSMTESSSRKSEADVGPRSFSLPIRPAEHSRSRSGALPRSRLYISQAAASSSPEKYARTETVATGDSEVVEREDPSHPSNQHVKYDQRTYTYLCHWSGDLHNRTTSKDWDQNSSGSGRQPQAPANANTHAPAGHSTDPESDRVDEEPLDREYHAQDTTFAVNSSYNEDIDTHSPVSSPPCGSEAASVSSGEFHSSPTHFQSFSRSPDQPTPPGEPTLPVLPPPFSATPRRISSNQVLPSSSPTNPFTTPHHYATSHDPTHTSSSPDPLAEPMNPFRTPLHPHTRPSTPAPHTAARPPTRNPRHFIPSPSPPPTTSSRRSLRVYNDSLPASSQPQTPVGLPRNGLPPMNSIGGAYTAPAGGRALRRQGFEQSGRQSPTRRPGAWMTRAWRGVSGANLNGEQENLGVESEVERRVREGLEERRERSGREEVDMTGNGGLDEEGLTRTPPRG